MNSLLASDRCFTAILLKISIVKLSHFPTYSVHDAAERVPPVCLPTISLPQLTKANFARQICKMYKTVSLCSKAVMI